MEKNYDFQARMRTVHRPARRIARPLPTGMIEITAGWQIVQPQGTGLLARTALDLQDYFATSMGISLSVTTETVSKNAIFYEIDPTLSGEDSYRVSVSADAIRLIGKNERAAAQASYLLEDLCNLEEAPFLAPGDTDRTPIFRCRMVHSGYRIDEFPDEHLSAIAHSGVNAILLFVAGVNMAPSHPIDFNDLIARAEKYGLDVYAYSYMKSRVHPDDPTAEAFYDNLYGELFRQCPGFKGIVFVGESVEFPSKDPRTCGRLRLDNIDANGRRIDPRPLPGWFPCSDYPQWLDVVKRTIRREKPDADIVFWTYNWGYCDEADRVALIDALPTDISLQATFEMFEDGERQGVPTRSTDYTLSAPLAGKYFLSEAKAAARRGIPLYSMTNAGGLTWDVGVVPYEPAPYQWLKRYEAMRECHEKYGLCGSMDSHHYGFYPSFVSDLAKEYFTAKDPDGEAIIEKLLARDWGREHVAVAKQAFRTFSDAVHDIITSNKDQYGPLRIGPAYPLVLFRDEKIVIPSAPDAHFKANEICYPNYKTKRPLTDPDERKIFEGEIRVYKSCADRMIESAAQLQALLPTLPAEKRAEAQRIAGTMEFMGRTLLTAHHVKRWYVEKVAIAADDGVLTAHLDTLREIGAAEIANVNATLPLVDFDSRLGFEPSMSYVGDRAHLEWKLDVMKRILEEEIPALSEEV